MWTIPIALAAGNVVILKPSEKVRCSLNHDRKYSPPIRFQLSCRMFAVLLSFLLRLCACVSMQVPMTMSRVAQLLAQAGVPPGVFQIINGTTDSVTSLIDHADVAAVTFVGSSKVAEIVAKRARALNKRVRDCREPESPCQ